MSADFLAERQKFLRIAELLEDSQTPADFRALMLICTKQPWHSFDVMALATTLANMGEALGSLICEDLDSGANSNG